MTSNEIEEGELLLRVAGFVPETEFHPFILCVARRLGLRGWIRHDASGALIRAEGTEEQLVRLVRAIRDGAPAVARVREMDTEQITAATPPVGDHFTVIAPGIETHDPSPEHPTPLARVA